MTRILDSGRFFYKTESGENMLKNNSEKLKSILKEMQQYNISSKKELFDESSLEDTNPIVIKGLNAIIQQGVKSKASDIHLEPQKNYLRVRYRLDGVLIDGEEFDLTLHNAIISRLKILSNLDITEKKLPQDGKFKMKIDDEEIDFRVSIVPLITGEKAVIRILDKNHFDFSLEKLGFSNEDYDKITKLIARKNGIILSSGPTGSGKSSLIYSILKKLNSPDVNISTVEDPVEYEIEGINQVQYNSEIGRDFKTILKAYLRQDPDILMIGEIRDYETAEIAVKSALTGHLVLSTIHTNDAVTTISRLANIGVENYIIANAVVGVIAQRLVRRLCDCKKEDENWKVKIQALGKNYQEYEKFKFYTKNGCEKCNNRGYLGRIAIFQIFIIDEKIKELIEERTSIFEIEKFALDKGMKKLVDDGIEKAILGITSLEEVLKQC